MNTKEIMFFVWMFLGLPLRLLLVPITFLASFVWTSRRDPYEMGGPFYFWDNVSDAWGMTLFFTLFGVPPWLIV